MFRQNLTLSFIVCISVFILAGCGKESKQDLIDFGGAQKISTESPADNGNLEVIKLSNGVVVYKDRSIYKKPDKEEKSDNDFGPRPIDFNPGSIKFNN
jgi:hypothetical protein